MTTRPVRALYVIDGERPEPDAASLADALVPGEVGWTVLVTIPDHPRDTTGATGFAGPVLTPDEMDERATAEVVAGDALAASAARAIGDRPITQRVVRGDAIESVRSFVDGGQVDIVAMADPDLARRVAAEVGVPTLVIPAS